MPEPKKLSTVEWLIIFVAIIGFAFDIYELLMLPLIVGPALAELIGAAPGSDAFNDWVGRLFYIPAFAGGIFGLLGGYLTDRLGRRRVLTWSILLYAFSAFAAGFSTSVEMLLFFRCLVFIGVCVEFVAAVAWLAELFPNPQQREKILGTTQAFSSIGGLLIAFANAYAIKHAVDFPAISAPDWLGLGEIKDAHAPWRYTLMSGLIPAIPLIIIRPFLPESPAWADKKAKGTLRRPSLGELFTPEFRRTTVVTTLMFACSYGAAFGAIQHIPRIIPGLAEVKAKAKAAVEKATADKPEEEKAKIAKQVTGRTNQAVAANVTKVQELGGLYGRALMASLVVIFLAAGRIRWQALVAWSWLVAWLVMEVMAEFGGEALEHMKRLGIGLVIGLIAGGLAWVVVTQLGRVLRPSARNAIRVCQVPGLIVMPVVFGYCAVTSLELCYVGIFVAGLLTVAQFSFWGNYLPKVYPVHLRGTGESFAANIGGRLIGTSFAWVTATLAKTPDTALAPIKLAYTAAAVGFAVYLVGFIASFWLPEPKQEMPD
jgi:MFS family permease